MGERLSRKRELANPPRRCVLTSRHSLLRVANPAMAETQSFNPRETYVHMRGDDRSATVAVSPEFWPDVMSGKRMLDGRLLMSFRTSEDTPHWEMHPAGEELIYLTTGAMKIILEDADGEQTCDLRAGEACLIPPGVWHRFLIGEPVEILAITAGVGTQHRALAGTGDE